MNFHKIQNPWIVWYHNPSDTDWSRNSYKDIIEITSIEDYCVLKNSWNSCLPNVSEGMFFLMRKLENGDTIYPQWEDPYNIKGGYWSFKIPKKNCEDIWFSLMKHILGECLLDNGIEYSLINGISISPKKNFSIVKLWLKESTKYPINTLLDSKVTFLNIKESIYADHSSNIRNDKYKQTHSRNTKHKDRYKQKQTFYNKKKYNKFSDFNNNNKCSW